MHLKKIVFILIIFTTSAISAQVNTPYSRYGLGNIFPTTFGASNAMAGISAAWFTPTNINFNNPASYSEITNATFEIGGAGNVAKLETSTESYIGGDGNLSYLAFAFPYLKKLHRNKFGLSFGPGSNCLLVR